MKNLIDLRSYRFKETKKKIDSYSDDNMAAQEETAGYFGPKSKKAIKPLVTTLSFITLVAIGAAIYFYFQAVKSNDPQKITQKEIELLVSRVGKLIVLPEGEQPTMATVTDPEKLKDQPFFSKAKNGDKVLIYTNARKAILYDPTQNKIIEVAPLNIGNK